MNEDKKEKAAKHIEEELCIAGLNVAFEVRCMLDACENAVIDRVLEIIDKRPNANPSYWNKCDVVDREGLREEILALKGGEQG